MNLLHIPFHDYRKAKNEGFRNRDTHFLQHIINHHKISNYKIINRPLLLHELIINPKKNLNYYKTKRPSYIFDSVNFNLIKPLTQKRKFIWEMYKNIKLELSTDYNILSHNLYSVDLVSKLKKEISGKVVFDAFDNWENMPFHQNQLKTIERAYSKFSELADYWITNSEENMEFFSKKYNVKNIDVLKNGVDPEKFSINYAPPLDLSVLKKPIFGFAGKISYLLDSELIIKLSNEITEGSIVLIGSVINKEKFFKIKGLKNVFYLGDKNYNDYPIYIKNFDVCLIPYMVEDMAHGGDSIKFYEYLSTGNPIVSTNGNGVYSFNSNVLIAKDRIDFINKCLEAIHLKNKKVEIPVEHTWKYKTKFLFDLFDTLNE